ncbi:hypothetical protein yc1106_03438 [Curvularia clavata]|uniref:Uncharacterized protein n=1 Tax=Curvularia clavata TaxID=95742 RepID=A0A9Q9DRX7_CURCL|nr:hypothetical protein yc1106_03438 [Curvularia clavata]
MAPSRSGGRTTQNERIPADDSDSEAQAPPHTTNTAGANFPVPRPPDPDAQTHGFIPHYHPTPTYRLIPGGPPTVLPAQDPGYDMLNFDPWRAQQAALAGAVQTPQMQTARMHQALSVPSPVSYGAPGPQFFHGSPQVRYGAVGNPYVYGSPQVSYPVQQAHESESPQAPQQGWQAYANLQNISSRPLEIRSRCPPSANMLQSPRGQLHFQPPPAQVSPPVQEWPTSNLSNTPAKKKREQKSREAQERAQQPADEHLTEAMVQQYRNTQPAPSTVPSTSGKRKAAVSDSQPPPTLPPSLRQSTPSLRTGPEDGTQYHSQYPHAATSDHHSISHLPLQSPHDTLQIPNYGLTQNEHESNELHPSSPSYGHQAGMHDSSHHEHASGPLPAGISRLPQHRELQSSAQPLTAEPVRREDIPQPITSKYENYKWPVKLYELRPDTKFDFVHAYMEDWFEKNILSSKYKWHRHTSQGFIQGGNRFSVLVLHNAADPFTWNTPSPSTTSFAVYGRFAHKHDELLWTTITPWIPRFIESSADFVLKNRWDFDMSKATEKRFHRAYWLAANMLNLRRLLHQHDIDENPHDEPDAADLKEAITFTEDDLQYQWVDGPMSAEHAEKVWKKIVDEVDCQPMDELGWEHMTIGCSERAWESDPYG